MRQRNDSGSVLHVSAHPTEQHPDRQPFDAGPGEVVDRPYPLTGFTPLDPPDGGESDADLAAGADATPAQKPAKPSRSKGAEGGEPR